MVYEHFRLEEQEIIDWAKSKGNKSKVYRSAVVDAYRKELNLKAEEKKRHIEVIIHGQRNNQNSKR